MDLFKEQILEGIPKNLPKAKPYDNTLNHPPKRADKLTKEEKELALRNALRYFDKKHHYELGNEFAKELKDYGRIYMYRFKPEYKIYARSIKDFPYKSKQAGAIMLMISNNLDDALAQYPEELITYGGNGSVFQNWAQYLLTMKYLAEMTDTQTLVLYSGHPLGLFPSNKEAPRVVVTNGMMIPNYSSKDDYEKYNAMGVTQYGQMTAGSFMYIGPQGIVHGTTITIMNAARIYKKMELSKDNKIMKLPFVYVSSGLGGMSGAQTKASLIAKCICVIAEINPKATQKRYEQGWIDEVYDDLKLIIKRLRELKTTGQIKSIAYQGNIVDLWEKLAEEDIRIELGSDQTSLHNPYGGGYYPVGLSFEESNELMKVQPEIFKEKVHDSLRRQVKAINKLADRGMYFWDYGNAFLLESGRAGAEVFKTSALGFRYPSYIEDIMGPLYFDYGFGPFRWICTSSDPKELELTDIIASGELEKMTETSSDETINQIQDNIEWIKFAGGNKLVVGSQARILYADSSGRIGIAKAFNKAIREGKIKEPIVIGRDHHDVSGTDSPYRETANIYDGSRHTADMSVQTSIGSSFRGATWVSLHNGGGVGWGEAINGGFGLVLDGSQDTDRRIEAMLFWDVNNGIARRAWARNHGALTTIKAAMRNEPLLKVTIPTIASEEIIESTIRKIFN